MSEKIVVCATDNSRKDEALEVSTKLGLDFVEYTENDELVFLDYGENAVKLINSNIEYYGDYSKLVPRIKQNNIGSEMIVKAAKIKGVSNNLTLVDATAGLGEDSLLLAAAGFNVTLFEQDPIIFELLKDTLNRALKDPKLCVAANNMKIYNKDSILELARLNFIPDVILLDPMFPERQKSGLVHKKFQLIHHLEKPCDNEDELVKSAIGANPQKIVIKRPLKGPNLANIKPSYSLKGKAIRYDCLVIRT